MLSVATYTTLQKYVSHATLNRQVSAVALCQRTLPTALVPGEFEVLIGYTSAVKTKSSYS